MGSTLGYAPPPTVVSLQTPIWPDSGTSKGELAKTESGSVVRSEYVKIDIHLGDDHDCWRDRIAGCAGRRCQTNQGDAIVDLSGPADFGTLSIADNARSMTMPALFAFSNTDRSDLEQVRQNLKRMPTKNKIFLSYPTGHGYELLQDQTTGKLKPLANCVQRFVAEGS